MIALVIGGAKSGKSMFAQNLAKSLENKSGKLYYIATMKPYDLEDLKRIENHLNERVGYGFNTIEEHTNMSKVVKLIEKNDTVLIDSITSIVTNSMFKGKEFYLNPDLIYRIDETPDTVITLVDGKTLVVRDTAFEIREAIIEYRHRIFSGENLFEGNNEGNNEEE